jgi:putative acetyltransferase
MGTEAVGKPRAISTAVDPPLATVALERPDQPEVVALIDALDAYQKPLYPPESHHGIDLPALRDPSVLFAVARLRDGSVAACGAVLLTPGYAELKRMFTHSGLRGRGVGAAVLRFVEEAARDRGASRLTIETGIRQPEALRLYERHGYVRCAPFGQYTADANSLFLEKHVTPAEPPCEVSIWHAVGADVDEVAPLFDAYRQFYGRAPDPALARSFLRERLARGESTVLMARDASGIACGFTQLYPSFSSARAAPIAILNDLFVARPARRRGIGRALLEGAARWARDHGLARLKLSTAVSNHPAQRLYESLGWIRDRDFFEYNLAP